MPGAGHRASRTPTQDTGAIEGLAAEIDATEGRLDILVNNADTTRVILHADLRALDDDFFDFVLAVNLAGPFATVRACRPLLEAHGAALTAYHPDRAMPRIVERDRATMIMASFTGAPFGGFFVRSGGGAAGRSSPRVRT